MFKVHKSPLIIIWNSNILPLKANKNEQTLYGNISKIVWINNEYWSLLRRGWISCKYFRIKYDPFQLSVVKEIKEKYDRIVEESGEDLLLFKISNIKSINTWTCSDIKFLHKTFNTRKLKLTHIWSKESFKSMLTILQPISYRLILNIENFTRYSFIYEELNFLKEILRFKEISLFNNKYSYHLQGIQSEANEIDIKQCRFWLTIKYGLKDKIQGKVNYNELKNILNGKYYCVQ